MPTLTELIAAIVKVLLMVGFVFNVAALLTWTDRRLSSMIQDRIGPNRAGLVIGKFNIRVLGLLHTAADGLKFFFKEDFLPPKADKLLFSLAPMLVMVPVLGLLAVIPMGDTVAFGDIRRVLCVDAGVAIARATEAGTCVKGVATTVWPAASRLGVNSTMGALELTIAPLNVGVLYVFALAGQGIVGAAIAGWSSDNKFSLMGALRAASQMVSYEVTMGLTLVGAMMVYGTVRLDDMVRWQGDNAWGIFVQPLAFFLFFAAAVAETKRIPFDLPEAESELVSGYFTEYSGMKFGMFYFAEYMEVVTSSMLLVTIFLGGWQLPFLHRDGLTIAFGETMVFATKLPHIWVIVFGVVAFFGKTLLMCVIQAFVRWSLPRFRYDQLMKLGWLVMLPLSLANIFATGIIFLAFDNGGPAMASGLKFAGDLTQGFVALLANGLFLWGIWGFFKPVRHTPFIVGSSAERAAKQGGTQTLPVEA
jgi:NADH-quinone oxidoreductase subunit H